MVPRWLRHSEVSRAVNYVSELPRIPRHGRALHEALVAGGVVGRRAVEDAAVVPDDEVPFLPLVAVTERGLGHAIRAAKPGVSRVTAIAIVRPLLSPPS